MGVGDKYFFNARVRKKHYYSTSHRIHERVEKNSHRRLMMMPQKSQQSGKWILINFK